MRILVVDDEANVREACCKSLARVGYDVAAAANAEEAQRLLDAQAFDLALLDIRMPGMDGMSLLSLVKARAPQVIVVMMTGYASVESAVECMKRGAAEYLAKPFTPEDVRGVVQRLLAARRAPAADELLTEDLQGPFTRSVIFGQSPAMRRVHALVEKVAGQNSHVLITGESGSGKELIARLLHERSPRAERPFVVVNCAAVPAALLESEFFGHRKGAFTGADYDRDGSFAAADGGTLFLDEIGEMPVEMQAKILRAIELGEIKAVGSDQPRRVDVRIISATNQNLAERVEAGEFRQDLFYRLNVVSIDLPPLRKRRSDIPVLAEHFLRRFAQEMGKPAARFSADALKALEAYAWPGNVRELENAVERAVMMAEGESIRPGDLPLEVAESALAAPVELSDHVNWSAIAEGAALPTLEDVSLAYMKYVLDLCDGNRTKAAKILGITPVTIWRKLGGAKESRR